MSLTLRWRRKIRWSLCFKHRSGPVHGFMYFFLCDGPFNTKLNVHPLAIWLKSTVKMFNVVCDGTFSKVALLKKRVKVVSDGTVSFEGEAPQAGDASNTLTQSPLKEQEEVLEGHEGTAFFSSCVFIQKIILLDVIFIFLPLHFMSSTGEGNSDPTKLLEALQKRVKRQENLLQKCKEVMRTHKERSTQLSTENETLQEQLQERLQELEKIKVAYSQPCNGLYHSKECLQSFSKQRLQRSSQKFLCLLEVWYESDGKSISIVSSRTLSTIHIINTLLRNVCQRLCGSLIMWRHYLGGSLVCQGSHRVHVHILLSGVDCGSVSDWHDWNAFSVLQKHSPSAARDLYFESLSRCFHIFVASVATNTVG